MFLFGTLSLSQSFGFTLHFSCSKLVCCKIMQSCRLAASMYRIHIHTEHSNTWTHARFFAHTSKCDDVRGYKHVLCLSHSDTCRCDCFPLQRSSKTAIPTGNLLSCYHPLAVTFALLETYKLGIVYTLADLTLSRQSSLLSNPLVYLVVCWVQIF